MKLKLAILMLSIVASSQTYAALSGYYTGTITQVGYEGSYGLVFLSTAFTEVGCSGMYLDLSDAAQRSAYSTALAAKLAGSAVTVRFETAGTKYYSNCPLFDIYLN